MLEQTQKCLQILDPRHCHLKSFTGEANFYNLNKYGSLNTQEVVKRQIHKKNPGQSWKFSTVKRARLQPHLVL